MQKNVAFLKRMEKNAVPNPGVQWLADTWKNCEEFCVL